MLAFSGYHAQQYCVIPYDTIVEAEVALRWPGLEHNGCLLEQTGPKISWVRSALKTKVVNLSFRDVTIVAEDLGVDSSNATRGELLERIVRHFMQGDPL